MKQFLKMTLATICGIVILGLVMTLFFVISLVGMVASDSAKTKVKENSVCLLCRVLLHNCSLDAAAAGNHLHEDFRFFVIDLIDVIKEPLIEFLILDKAMLHNFRKTGGKLPAVKAV